MIRCRRAAALSFLGWYLLSPPPRADPKSGSTSPVLIDSDRPLRDWKIVHSFSSAGECRSYLKDWIIQQQLKADSLPKPISSKAVLELNVRSNSQCVESDDPRLTQR
jgi:hypothetical protein